VSQDNDMLITNDGASVLSHLNVQHPVPRLLVELSKCQDEVAGDGTTSVVLLAAEFLRCGFQLRRQSVPVAAIVQVGSFTSRGCALMVLQGISSWWPPLRSCH